MDVLFPSMSIHPLLKPVVSWLFTTMLAAVPPERLSYGRTYAEAVETVDQTKARYEEFASVVARVAYDPAEKPLFDGPDGRAKTAAVMLSVAFYESGFRRDVATGKGKHARGDHGRSCTPWQFNIGTGKNAYGHTCDELLADQDQAARDALQVLRSAMRGCTGLPVEERLSMYLTGRCEGGVVAARSRWSTAVRWLGRRTETWHDDHLAESLKVAGFED